MNKKIDEKSVEKMIKNWWTKDDFKKLKKDKVIYSEINNDDIIDIISINKKEDF